MDTSTMITTTLNKIRGIDPSGSDWTRLVDWLAANATAAWAAARPAANAAEREWQTGHLRTVLTN